MCLVPEETKVQVKRQFIIGIPPPFPPPRCLWDMPKLRKTIPDQVMVFTSQLTPHSRYNRAQPAGTSRLASASRPRHPCPIRALHQLFQPSHGPSCPGAAAAGPGALSSLCPWGGAGGPLGAAARPGQPRLSPSARRARPCSRASAREGISSPAHSRPHAARPQSSCRHHGQRWARDRARLPTNTAATYSQNHSLSCNSCL